MHIYVLVHCIAYIFCSFSYLWMLWQQYVCNCPLIIELTFRSICTMLKAIWLPKRVQYEYCLALKVRQPVLYFIGLMYLSLRCMCRFRKKIYFYLTLLNFKRDLMYIFVVGAITLTFPGCRRVIFSAGCVLKWFF